MIQDFVYKFQKNTTQEYYYFLAFFRRNFKSQQDKNPANIPAARPIEDFQAYLKRLVYEGDWSAKTTDALQQRIKYCLSKIDIYFVQDLAHDTHKRLRKFATGELLKLKK